MFPPELEKTLVASYMLGGLELVQARSLCDRVERTTEEKFDKQIAAQINPGLQQGRLKSAEELQAEYEMLQAAFRNRDVPPIIQRAAADIVADYNKVNGSRIRPTTAEMNSFSLKILDSLVRVKGIEKAVLEQGHLHHLEEAKAALQQKLQKPFRPVAEIMAAYLKWYREQYPDVKTYESEVIPQCNLLIELLGGSTSINEVNTVETISELKAKLRKYPKNKTSRFRDKSLSAIIRSGAQYEKLALKTADKYFTRLYSVLDYCQRHDYISGPNRAQGERVSTKRERQSILPEDQRKSYDYDDIVSLVDALCTRPLSFNKTLRNERFWVLLICFIHSIRPGNVLGLTKAHFKDVQGTWCVDLGEYSRHEAKNPQTRRVLTPVHPMLLYFGFRKWFDKLGRDRLFFDSVDSLSRWYNRNEKDARTGKMIQGFEARYITTDPKKCLYSSRHFFGTAGNETGIDMKILKDMMGHKQDGQDQTRSRYAKRSSIDAQVTAQMGMWNYYVRMGFDVERLKARAQELFDLP